MRIYSLVTLLKLFQNRPNTTDPNHHQFSQKCHSIDPNNKKQKSIVTVKKDLNNVLIIVEDNGNGISPEDINRIFEFKFTTKTAEWD
jgi:signal transduction histidine kinase